MRLQFSPAISAERRIKVIITLMSSSLYLLSSLMLSVYVQFKYSPCIADIASKTVTSESKPDAFPSALRSKRSAVQTLTAEDKQTDAVIQETCPECGRTEMRFYTLQLRSADEGTTVFYSCECGHKYAFQFRNYNIDEYYWEYTNIRN